MRRLILLLVMFGPLASLAGAASRNCFAEAKAKGLTSGPEWKAFLNKCFSETPPPSGPLTMSVQLGKAECGDTCAIQIQTRSGLRETALCAAEDLRAGSKVPVCREIFGNGSAPPNMEGRSATLTFNKDRNGNRFIVGGKLIPAAGSGSPDQRARSEPGTKQPAGLDALVSRTPEGLKSANAKITGKAPGSINEILLACSGGSLYPYAKTGQVLHEVMFASPVKASELTGFRGSAKKDTPIYSTRFIVDDWNSRDRIRVDVQVWKDEFGTLNCIG